MDRQTTHTHTQTNSAKKITASAQVIIVHCYHITSVNIFCESDIRTVNSLWSCVFISVLVSKSAAVLQSLMRCCRRRATSRRCINTSLTDAASAAVSTSTRSTETTLVNCDCSSVQHTWMNITEQRHNNHWLTQTWHEVQFTNDIDVKQQ